MNEKERIKKCINFDKPDKIPWQINCTTDIAEKLIQNLRIKKQKCMVLGKNIYFDTGCRGESGG